MTLVPFNKHDIDALTIQRVKKEDTVNTLISFIEMDADCVEIKEHSYANALSCQTTMVNTIKYLGLLGVKAVRRGERVFLIKEQ